MKTIQINGDTYEIKKKIDYEENYKNDIYDLYERPSDTKREIFNYRNNKIIIKGLTGGRFFFTIYGLIKDDIGNFHKVRITANHNYILDDGTL